MKHTEAGLNHAVRSQDDVYPSGEGYVLDKNMKECSGRQGITLFFDWYASHMSVCSANSLEFTFMI